jgi:hypothetical protein
VKVPGVSKVRETDAFELTPGIFGGAPVAASKKMLCPTDPNANVTACPAWVFKVAGVNARDAVASTWSATGGGVGGVGVGAVDP